MTRYWRRIIEAFVNASILKAVFVTFIVAGFSLFAPSDGAVLPTPGPLLTTSTGTVHSADSHIKFTDDVFPFTEATRSFSTKTGIGTTIDPTRRTCAIQADCRKRKLGEICHPTSNECVCPPHKFRSDRDAHCKAQVVVYANLSTTQCKDDFSDLLSRSREFVDMATDFEYEKVSGGSRAIFFVDATGFNTSWNKDERSLKNLLNSSEEHMIVDLTVVRNPCSHSKSRPCHRDAICISSAESYHVECLCKPGFRELSDTHSGHLCIREPRCLNGAVLHMHATGLNGAQTECRCTSLFAGEYCEINLLRLGLTLASGVAFCTIAVWTHPTQCRGVCRRNRRRHTLDSSAVLLIRDAEDDVYARDTHTMLSDTRNREYDSFESNFSSNYSDGADDDNSADDDADCLPPQSRSEDHAPTC